MGIEFRGVSLGCLRDFSAAAPDGAVIGVIGSNSGGQNDFLRLAGGAAFPSAGDINGPSRRRYIGPMDVLDLSDADIVAVDHTYDAQDALLRSHARYALHRLRASGATIFLASHEAAVVRTVSDEAWWVENGALAKRGDPGEVWSAYMDYVAEQFRSGGRSLVTPMSPAFRRGDGRAEVVSIETLGADGSPTTVWRSGEHVSVRARVRYNTPVHDPVIGIMIRTRVGSEVYGTNTELEGMTLGPCVPGQILQIEFAFRCDLCNNEYTLTIASHDRDGTAHDWVDDALAFLVADSRYTAGVANLRARVKAATLPSPPEAPSAPEAASTAAPETPSSSERR